jgi:pyruvate dehydrogenase E1 component alpha subunit
MPGVAADGNDVEEMARVTREAADRARAGEGPTFIEAKTYRFRGHSMSDPMKYRTKEEAQKAKERDPIVVYESLLKERGWVDGPALEELHEKVKREVDEAIEFAEAAPEPAPEALYEDITISPFVPQE